MKDLDNHSNSISAGGQENMNRHDGTLSYGLAESCEIRRPFGL